MKLMQLAARTLVFCVCALACLATDAESVLHGKLVQAPGKTPAIETADHRLITVTGDEPTRGVLKDKRIANMELEVKGVFTSANEFRINPIEKRSMIALKDGKRYRITYYCDTCSIRTYTPGPCMCCQEETRLDLIDPSQN